MGKSEHLGKLRFKCQYLRDIESAGQVVHRHWQDSRTETRPDSAFTYTRLDDLEECAKETVACSQVLIHRIVILHEQLVGEIIIFINQYI